MHSIPYILANMHFIPYILKKYIPITYIGLNIFLVPLNIRLSRFGSYKIFRLVLVPHFLDVTNVSP